LDKEFDMKIKKIFAGAAMAGALGIGAVATAGGVAQADPKPWPPPIPPIPGDVVWLPGDPPGHNPWGPPGQVKKNPFTPLYGVPPGHWDDPVAFGLPAVWLPPDIDGVTVPLPVRFNPDFSGWGVWVNPDWFIPLPQV
jgi:hypothetical protein